MPERLDFVQGSPEPFSKLLALSTAIHAGAVEAALVVLVDVRVAQLNGCAFCLDMHVKDAAAKGFGELKLHHVGAWHDSPLFSDRERAALAWTEALTLIAADGVSDAQYAAARAVFGENELSDLTFAIATLNAWTRLDVAFRTAPGAFDRDLGLDAGLLRGAHKATDRRLAA